MARIVLAFVLLAILGSMSAVAFQAGLEDAGTDIAVDNESFEPEPTGEWLLLDNSEQEGSFYDEETRVFDQTDNPDEMEEGVDYLWNVNNGTVWIIEGGGLDGEAGASITYSFTNTTDEQQMIASLSSHIPIVIGLAIPLFAIVLFMRFVGG